MYVLDTDIVIDFLHGEKEIIELIKKFRERHITTATLCELFYGVYNSSDIKKHYIELMNFLMGVNILNEDFLSCENFGKIKTFLKKKGKLIGDFDIMNASITIANDFVLVTRNKKHYEGIRDLKIL